MCLFWNTKTSGTQKLDPKPAESVGTIRFSTNAHFYLKGAKTFVDS
jgi:hypothetical protein